MSDIAITEQGLEKQKLLHDLRGPLINAAAFNSELTEAIERLCKFLENSNSELSAEQCVEINTILQEDVTLCNRYIQLALNQMQERLNKFDR